MSSYWIESTAQTAWPALEGDISVDVAVVGGGMKRLVRGATGYTTAKVTSGHGLDDAREEVR